MKNLIKKLPFVKRWLIRLDNLNERRDFVKEQLEKLPAGSLLLDAGCGSQQFRQFASHLTYKAQDFGQYSQDEKGMLGDEEGGAGGAEGYQYGTLDYIGDIWAIDEKDTTFDAILCTEVIEHIPYPVETIHEFARLLKPGGTLILTAPSNCLRHMDPYFFTSGFSDRWFEKFLPESGLEIEALEPVGDYYSWLGVEVARTASFHGFFTKLILFPAFLFYFSRKKTKISVDTLCMGYHVVARKKSGK